MRLVFMGTPQFAVPSLKLLCEEGYRPAAVVTGPDRPRGRGQRVQPTPIKTEARKLSIDCILQPESVRSSGFAAAIRDLAPDVIVVVAFKILPPAVYQHAQLAAFNLHASLLPKYRGAAPINWAIIKGEAKTGVTTFLLEPEVDCGNIILQREMSIGENETAGELHDRMMEIGAGAVVETVRQLQDGTAEPREQNDAEATPAPKIFQDDCRIPWDLPAGEVHNHIRGLSPYPGAWTLHDEARLKIYRSELQAEEGAEHKPGTILSATEELIVSCASGFVQITDVQQPGRRRLPAEDFLRGYDLSAGETFS